MNGGGGGFVGMMSISNVRVYKRGGRGYGVKLIRMEVGERDICGYWRDRVLGELGEY